VPPYLDTVFKEKRDNVVQIYGEKALQTKMEHS
jgi:hypothetical protein